MAKLHAFEEYNDSDVGFVENFTSPCGNELLNYMHYKHGFMWSPLGNEYLMALSFLSMVYLSVVLYYVLSDSIWPEDEPEPLDLLELFDPDTDCEYCRV